MLRLIHVFQCGRTDLFGLTEDHTGANLPSEQCGEGWRFLKTVEYQGGMPPWGLDVASQDRAAAVQAGIANNGFFIGERSALPDELV
jgi:hypothetical protein